MVEGATRPGVHRSDVAGRAEFDEEGEFITKGLEVKGDSLDGLRVHEIEDRRETDTSLHQTLLDDGDVPAIVRVSENRARASGLSLALVGLVVDVVLDDLGVEKCRSGFEVVARVTDVREGLVGPDTGISDVVPLSTESGVLVQLVDEVLGHSLPSAVSDGVFVLVDDLRVPDTVEVRLRGVPRHAEAVSSGIRSVPDVERLVDVSDVVGEEGKGAGLLHVGGGRVVGADSLGHRVGVLGEDVGVVVDGRDDASISIETGGTHLEGSGVH